MPIKQRWSVWRGHSALRIACWVAPACNFPIWFCCVEMASRGGSRGVGGGGGGLRDPGSGPPLNFASYNFIIYYFSPSKTPDSSLGIQSHSMGPLNGMSGSTTGINLCIIALPTISLHNLFECTCISEGYIFVFQYNRWLPQCRYAVYLNTRASLRVVRRHITVNKMCWVRR